ncbi:hypothetical protein KY092_18875 [Natronomonas gomsonensis]|uniref:ArsR/SmtB family transcription factor n=1 Tax=Natronomonas gomsonensis TaxID=1046043 RepID=UPI00227BCC51|nr:hypothetical protein [Natronomonas gomsonensis]MCY4732608.1 hypothetical protein [Natronomonas gomsonensis]
MKTTASEITGVDSKTNAVNDVSTEMNIANEWDPVDETFRMLSNHRRRQVLLYLQENGSAAVGELAEHIASIENRKPVTAVSSRERKRVYIALHQSHLSKMAEAGIIEYNKNRGTVSSTPNVDRLCRMVSDPTPERRWSLYYLVQTAISVIVVAVGAIFFSASISLLAGILLAGYAALAIVHSVGEYYSGKRHSDNTEKHKKPAIPNDRW